MHFQWVVESWAQGEYEEERGKVQEEQTASQLLGRPAVLSKYEHYGQILGGNG